MRTIPPGLAAHLAGAATTLATAWIVRRTDGVVLGFTDHDRGLVVDGVACEPASGFDRSAATRVLGLAVGEEEVAGALSSGAITEADLAAGLWDGAAIEVHLVNWTAPAERLLQRSGTIGEVVRADGAFRAEVRGPAHALDQPTGRLFARQCDAELGDARCGVDLAPLTDAGTVAAMPQAGRIRIDGLPGRPDGWYANGRLRFLDGPLAGRTVVIAGHGSEDGTAAVAPWRPLADLPAEGDAVEVVAGCDKAFSTCVGRFGNGPAFRGFPHIPGRDFAFSFARDGGRNDGGRL